MKKLFFLTSFLLILNGCQTKPDNTSMELHQRITYLEKEINTLEYSRDRYKNDFEHLEETTKNVRSENTRLQDTIKRMRCEYSQINKNPATGWNIFIGVSTLRNL